MCVYSSLSSQECECDGVAALCYQKRRGVDIIRQQLNPIWVLKTKTICACALAAVCAEYVEQELSQIYFS